MFQELYDSLTYPLRCKCATGNWFAFLVLVLILSFLWNMVIKQIQ